MKQRENIFILDVEIAFTPSGTAYVVGADDHIKKYGYSHVRKVFQLLKLHNADYR